MDTKNSQYGTQWINNGTENKKIKTGDSLTDGWKLGRINVHSDEMKKVLSEAGKRCNPEKRKRTILEKYGSFSTEQRIDKINEYWVRERDRKSDMSFDKKSMDYKRLQIFEEQNGVCLHCSLSKWLGRPLKFELDHIDGNNKNNTRNNLRILCPNCHSFTDTWRKKKDALLSQLVEETVLEAV